MLSETTDSGQRIWTLFAGDGERIQVGKLDKLEGLMLKLKLQYFGHLVWRTDSLEKILMLGKIGGKRRGWERMRRLDGILTWWTWVWASSGSWWWTGKPDVLQSMGSQRLGHDWVTELNWEYTVCVCVCAQWGPLCNPMDCSPPGSSAHGVLFQARILKQAAICYSRVSSQWRDWTESLASSSLAGGFFSTGLPGSPKV